MGGVVSKSLSAEKNVIAVTRSLLAACGSLEGGVGRGSGEARSVSDTKFQNRCHVIWGYRESVKMGSELGKIGVYCGKRVVFRVFRGF